MKIQGLIAAAYAPFQDNGLLNTSIVPQYADFLIKNNIKGVFINGSTGDFVSLSLEERKELMNAWSRQKKDGFIIINHVGSTNLNEAKELAFHSKDKADAISAIAPYYFKIRKIEKLVEYCKEIASMAPELPFYYYHLPVLSGAYLNMQEFLKLAHSEIPNLRGIKYTSEDLIDFKQASEFKNGSFNILFGYDEWFLNSLPIGASGWVGSTYNHLAPLYQLIKENFDSGKMEEASRLQDLAVRFVQLLDSKGGFNGAGKSFMKQLGIDCGASRFPHITLKSEDFNEIDTQLEKIGIKPYMNKLPINMI